MVFVTRITIFLFDSFKLPLTGCKAKKAVEITFNVSKQDKNKENLVRDVGFRTMEGEAYLEFGNRKTRTLLYSTG